MDQEVINIIVEIFTLENGNMVRKMVLVHFFGVVEINMKGFGKKMKSMAKEHTNMLMVIFSKEHMKMVKRMEKEN